MKKVLLCCFSFLKNHLFKALISFLFINGIVFLVDNKFKLTELANSATLRNIQSSLYENIYQFDNNSKSLVILISNTMFEKTFNSTTPLNKDTLLTLIQRIDIQKPKALILDFDISPDYNFINNTNNLQAPLFNYLKDMTKEKEIILPFAFFASNKENKKLKNLWLQQMCKSGINFAYPHINSEIGVVLNYNNYHNHISIYTNKLLSGNIKSITPCKTIQKTNFEKTNKQATLEFLNSNSFPINYNKINNQTFIINNINDLRKINLHNKVIFLGGGYGFTDKYQTAYGEKFGVEILNAIFYTQNHRINIASIHFTTILDIILGLFFGIFLSIILRKKVAITNENEKVILNIGLIIYLMIFILFSNWISSYIFHNLYIWLNPIPIIVGMFIDMILGIDRKKLKNDLKNSWLRLLIRYIFVFIGIYSFI